MLRAGILPVSRPLWGHVRARVSLCCAALSRYVPLNVPGKRHRNAYRKEPSFLPSGAYGGVQGHAGVKDVRTLARLLRAVSGVFRGRETVSLHVGSVSLHSLQCCAVIGFHSRIAKTPRFRLFCTPEARRRAYVPCAAGCRGLIALERLTRAILAQSQAGRSLPATGARTRR